MKKAILFLIISVMLMPTLLFAQGLKGSSGRFYATIEKTFDVSTGGHLEVNRVTGDYKVTGWDKAQVNIIQEIEIKSFTKAEAEEIYKRAQNAIRISGNRVMIEGDYNGNRVHNTFTIQVPAVYNIDLKTQGGDIDLHGVEGQADIGTSGGDIKVVDTAGRTKASTSGGDLTFSDVSGVIHGATSGGDIDLENIFGEGDFSTSGGDITVRNATDKIKVNTSGGSIRIENVGADVHANTSGGDIVVQQVKGSCGINTSGGDIRLDEVEGPLNANTSGGDITGADFSAKVSVNTSGGDINLNQVKAAVNARTSGGNVKVRMALEDYDINHAVHLQTSGGSIDLTIPPDLPATIFAEIKMSRGNYERERYDIYSDFPLTKTGPDEHGQVIIRSEGEINGGGDPIRLETTGGDIHIRKGK